MFKITKRFLVVVWATLFFLSFLGPTPVFAVKSSNSKIVMLGDSITLGGAWNKLLQKRDVINQGVKSDTTRGFVNRLDRVYEQRPKVSFIMGGINDIASGIQVRSIYKNYTVLIKKLKSQDIIPVIQSTLYTRNQKHNIKVEKLNKMLLRYSKKHKIEFIDLNKKMSKNKVLLTKYTSDGLHLSRRAYDVWGKELQRVIQKHQW